MAQPVIRLPPHLQPRPKAAATASSASLNGLAGSTSSGPSRSSSQNRAGSPLSSSGAAAASDSSIDSLIRRTLCPYSQSNLRKPQPLDELLPPLTSSNEVDLQLYAILAVIVKEFVYSWYGKLTPDQSFVEEIIRIVAHCTRDLEQRLRRVDLISLLLDEIPALLCNHVSSQNASRDPPHPACLSSDPREVYHALNPHPAFSPIPRAFNPQSQEEQERNERYYRQLLVHGALAVLLPTEDLQSPPLRILVSDILGEMILGKGVGRKTCEGWMLWDGITKLVASTKAQMNPKRTGEEIEEHTRSRLERFGLLADQQHGRSSDAKGRRRRKSLVSDIFWRMLQYCYLVFVSVHFIITGLISTSSSHQTIRRRKVATYGSGKKRDEKESHARRRGRSGSPMIVALEAPGEARPILSFALFGLVSQLLDLQWRMPWIHGLLTLIQWHLTRADGLLLGLGAKDGLIDRFIRTLLEEHVLKASRVPQLFQQLRLAIFPNNAMGSARAEPSEPEQKAIRREAAASLLSLFPQPVARRLLATSSSYEAIANANLIQSQVASGSAASLSDNRPSPLTLAAQGSELRTEEESLIAEVENILDIFADSYMNKHLIFGIVELCFVRLLPELGETGVRELLEERGVAV